MAPLVLGPVYCSLDVDATDVTVETTLEEANATAVDVDADTDADAATDTETGETFADVDVCTTLGTVCRLNIISAGTSTVMGDTVLAVDSAGTGSKQTSNSVVPEDVCNPAKSFKSIQLAPTLSLSVRGKLSTLVSFSSTM